MQYINYLYWARIGFTFTVGKNWRKIKGKFRKVEAKRDEERWREIKRDEERQREKKRDTERKERKREKKSKNLGKN